MSNPIKNITGEKAESSESETWNIAKGYTQLRILKLMIDVDKFERIARFGYYEFEEKYSMTPEIRVENRLEAIDLLLHSLLQVLDNVNFAIKKEDRGKMKEFNERLLNVERVLDRLSYQYEDLITHETERRINQDLFNKCLNIIRTVKTEMNIPINKAGLIFRVTDEVDLDAMMNDVIHGG